MEYKPFPVLDKKYDIIYLDPPWKYLGGPQHTKVGSSGGAETHYPVLTLKQLATLDIPSIAKDDCLLFMWATAPKLDWAIRLGLHWEFKYITIAFVWDKIKLNPGNYTMSQCEYVLVFKKGKIPQPKYKTNIRQLLSEKRKEHSMKPDTIRNRITLIFPYQDKIELFARKESYGWDSWGNEV